MTCWRSCSASALVVLVVALDPAGAAAVDAGSVDAGSLDASASAGRSPDAGTVAPAARPILLLPPVNLTPQSFALDTFAADWERALVDAGVPLVPREAAEAHLARYRVRYTGAVSSELALTAGVELGAIAVLVTSVDYAHQGANPRLSISARLVSATSPPQLVWADGVAHAGDEAPGWFDLGVITEATALRRKAVDGLAASVRRFLDGRPSPAQDCPTGPEFEPRTSFRSPLLELHPGRSIVVVPFINDSGRRNAGELVALDFIRQLTRVPNLRVVEPGVVREELLRYRITLEGGLSLDTARLVLELLQADLLLTGKVHEYVEPGALGTRVHFSALILERANNEIVWHSSSGNDAGDAVIAFDLGRAHTTQGLSCRMARAVVKQWSAPRRTDRLRSLGPQR